MLLTLCPNFVIFMRYNDLSKIFCLDNDEAGRAAKEKLLELPHDNKFKFFNLLAEGEDFEEFYKRVLLKELYKWF